MQHPVIIIKTINVNNPPINYAEVVNLCMVSL